MHERSLVSLAVSPILKKCTCPLIPFASPAIDAHVDGEIGFPVGGATGLLSGGNFGTTSFAQKLFLPMRRKSILSRASQRRERAFDASTSKPW